MIPSRFLGSLHHSARTDMAFAFIFDRLAIASALMLDITWTTVLDRFPLSIIIDPIEFRLGLHHIYGSYIRHHCIRPHSDLLLARPTHDGSMPPHIHPSSFRLSSLQTFVTIFQLFCH